VWLDIVADEFLIGRLRLLYLSMPLYAQVGICDSTNACASIEPISVVARSSHKLLQN